MVSRRLGGWSWNEATLSKEAGEEILGGRTPGGLVREMIRSLVFGLYVSLLLDPEPGWIFTFDILEYVCLSFDRKKKEQQQHNNNDSRKWNAR